MSYPQAQQTAQQTATDSRYERALTKEGVVGMMKIYRQIATAGTAVCLAFGLAACGSTHKQAVPPITSPSATATQPAWAAKFTKAQLADYATALDTFTKVEKREAPIWANPQQFSASEVQAIFKSDWITPQLPMNRYTGYLANQVRSVGIQKVLSSELTSMKSNTFGGGGQLIVILQCVDGSGIRNFIGGKSVAPSKGSSRGERDLAVVKTVDGRFLINSVNNVGRTSLC